MIPRIKAQQRKKSPPPIPKAAAVQGHIAEKGADNPFSALQHTLGNYVAQQLYNQCRQQAEEDLNDGGTESLKPPESLNEKVLSQPDILEEHAPAPEEKPAEKELPSSDKAEIPSEEAAVDITFPKSAAPAEASVEKIEVLELKESSDEAMAGFTGASASQIAASYPTLGTQLNQILENEKEEEIENAPVLTAQIEGTLSKDKEDDVELNMSGSVKIDDGVTESEPGELQPEEHKNDSEAPDNKVNLKSLDQQKGEMFLSWFRNFFGTFFGGILTTDRGLNTGAGEGPQVELSGKADLNRTDRQKKDAGDNINTQRDDATEKFATHPGQKNIQPKKIDETFSLELSKDLSVTIEDSVDEGMQEYLEIPLPKDVRNKADEILKPALEKSLTKVESSVEEAVNERDTEKKAQIEKTNEEADKLNQQAQENQENAVVENREKVAKEQQSGIDEAYGLVETFNKESEDEQKSAKDAIREKSDKARDDAQKELDKGESEAQAIKEQGEEDARKKKEELDKEQESDSWWDRAVDTVKSAVKAITDVIDTIFTAIRKAVKEVIEAAKNVAVGLINAARTWIIDKLDQFRDWAKSQVDTYLKEYFPKLAKTINNTIDAVVDTAITVVNTVADGLIAGIEALAKALAAALDKILAVFQTAMKAAVQIAGAVLTGDFAEALKIAIQAACNIAGIDSKPIFDFFERAGSQIMKILKKPAVFFGNLINAVSGGVENFVKNIREHLINGLFGWLTGALSEVQITLPGTLGPKAIFSLVMQILGLTYENIKAKIIRRVPASEKVFDIIEDNFEIIKEVFTKGPIALWHMVVATVSNLKETVLSGIRNFVIFTVAKEAMIWLLAMLNPASALVKVIKLLYDFVMFLVERFNQIKDFVLSVYTSMAAIAAGALDPAIKAVEDALGRSLPVVLSLLARLAGLGGIGKTVKEIIADVSKPVNKVVETIVDNAVTFAEKLLGKGKGKEIEKRKEKKTKSVIIDKDLGETLNFSTGKERHRLWIKKTGGKPEVMVASKPITIPGKLAEWKKEVSTLEEKDQASAKQYISEALELYKKTKGYADTEDKVQTSASKDNTVTISEKSSVDRAEHNTLNAEHDLQKHLRKLFSIFDKEEAVGLLKKYKQNIETVHRSAKHVIQSDTAAIKESDAQTIKSWEDLTDYHKKHSNVKNLYEKPLSSQYKTGNDIINNEAISALEQSVKENPESWKKYKEKNKISNEKAGKKTFVSTRVGVIYGGQNDAAKKAMVQLQAFIFSQSRSNDAQSALKSYYAKSLEGNTSAEHAEYKPHISEGGIAIEDNRFTVSYAYANEQHYQKSFEVSFDFSKINDANEVVQATKGKNLTLKEAGSRGKTASSGEVKEHSKAEKADSSNHQEMFKGEYLKKFIKEKYGNEYLQEKMKSKKELTTLLNPHEKREFEESFAVEYKKFEHLKGEQKFDSAHILADWFGGSGYKEALNLLVTSAEYNRIVMGGAEKNIVKDIKNKSEDSFFDLSVTATWDILSDSEIKSQISEKTIKKQLPKNQGISEEGMNEIAKGSETDLYNILISKQDPRRVLKVNYEGDITLPQQGKLNEKIGCDIWMSNYFKFDKKEKCIME